MALTTVEYDILEFLRPRRGPGRLPRRADGRPLPAPGLAVRPRPRRARQQPAEEARPARGARSGRSGASATSSAPAPASGGRRDVRSIFAKILLWSLGTFALSLVAFWAISRSLERRAPGPDDFFGRMIAMQEDEAGPRLRGRGPRAARGLPRPARRLLPRRAPPDRRPGRDLVSGEDRSDLLAEARRPGAAPPARGPDGPRRPPAGRPLSVPRDRPAVVRPRPGTSCPTTARSSWSSP